MSARAKRTRAGGHPYDEDARLIWGITRPGYCYDPEACTRALPMLLRPTHKAGGQRISGDESRHQTLES